MEFGTKTNPIRIAVIGAGASGLIAAVSACEVFGGGEGIVLFERNEKAGRKLLATGNGRCNFTNIYCSEYDLGRFSSKALKHLSPEGTIAFFKKLGIIPRVEAEGRVYPYSGQGASVQMALVGYLNQAEAEFRYRTVVNRIGKTGGLFEIETADGRVNFAERIVVATGGKAGIQYGSIGDGYRFAKAFSHRLVKPIPALVQVNCPQGCCEELKGIRAKGSVSLESQGRRIAEDRGEIQFTEDGLSGICVFNISRKIRYEKENTPEYHIIVDLAPEIPAAKLNDLLKARRKNLSERLAEEFLTGFFHEKLAPVLLAGAQIELRRKIGEISDGELQLLGERIKHWRFPVESTKSWKDAQVTAGGIAVQDVHEDTMESQLAEGLYFVGEILDVDGRCGGYNLQWAWSSGYVAGRAAAVSLERGAAAGQDADREEDEEDDEEEVG